MIEMYGSDDLLFEEAFKYFSICNDVEISLAVC
jgi:hypothetical protein